jgi:hypothetical protein
MAVKAKKIHTAKTKREYNSSKVPLSARRAAIEPRKSNEPLGVRKEG